MIDDVARRTLGSRQGWWLTVGVVFTLWQTSGVARAIMGALSRVYGDGEDRSFVRRYLTSFALGLAVAVCVLAALVIVRFGAADPRARRSRVGRRGRARSWSGGAPRSRS